MFEIIPFRITQNYSNSSLDILTQNYTRPYLEQMLHRVFASRAKQEDKRIISKRLILKGSCTPSFLSTPSDPHRVTNLTIVSR